MIFEKIAMMLDASEFKKGEIVANYVDFICATRILCVGTLESFKLHLGYKLG